MDLQDAKTQQQFTDVKADIRVLKWMMGFVLAGIVSLVTGMGLLFLKQVI